MNNTAGAGFNIYPNPVHGIIHYSLPYGETCMHSKLTDGVGKTVLADDLNTDMLQPGIYFLEIKTESRIYYSTVILN
jgi:hypothetical protein